jgi:hypothetical protein
MVDRIPLWVMFLVVLLASVGAIEVGYRWGRRLSTRGEETESESMLGSTVGAHMGLLAFILAFTFSFSAERLDARKALVIDEANAIGRAELRSRYLPPEHATKVHALLTEYTELRAVKLPQRQVTLEEAIVASDRLLAELWKHAEAVSHETVPSDEMRSLFVSSINEVIETNTRRVTVVMRGRIPPMIWGALALITVLGFGALGYQGGLRSPRRSLSSWPLILSFCAVIVVIVDLDRPWGSLIHVSQRPLLHTLELEKHEP